jgi:hypothetical protein
MVAFSSYIDAIDIAFYLALHPPTLLLFDHMFLLSLFTQFCVKEMLYNHTIVIL